MPRQILESGKAYKLVKLSRAPQEWDADKLADAVDYHTKDMRKELKNQGKLVQRVEKTISGVNGDMQLTAFWVILGKKLKPKDLRNGTYQSTPKAVQGESPFEP